MSESIISYQGRQIKEPVGRLPTEDRTGKPAEIKKKPVEISSKPAEMPHVTSSFGMTSVQFKVDTDTKDVVILIKEKSTDHVLRTIPAEAIKDLPPGQLVDIYG